MRNTITVTTFGLCLLLAAFAQPTLAAPRRIHIPHGHGTVYVHGYLRGYQSRARYVLYGHKGQHLSLLGPGVVMVYFPNGSYDGAPGGVDTVLPVTGDNHITVSEHTVGEPWRGPLTLKVRLQ